MLRSITLAAVCAAAALALTSCGEPDVVSTSRPLLEITLDEYRIMPQNISVKRDPTRNGRLKIIVHNVGRLTHNLVIQIPPPKPREPAIEVARVKTMAPGATESIKVSLPPRKYDLLCTIAGHDDLGQTGEFEVKE